MFDEQVDAVLREVCLENEKQYGVKFIEIGVDKDPVHFGVQSAPTYSETKLVMMIKCVTARKVCKRCPQVKLTCLLSPLFCLLPPFHALILLKYFPQGRRGSAVDRLDSGATPTCGE